MACWFMLIRFSIIQDLLTRFSKGLALYAPNRYKLTYPAKNLSRHLKNRYSTTIPRCGILS
jgi:hypothetical protein